MLSPIVETIGKIIFNTISLILNLFPPKLMRPVARLCAFFFFIFSPGKRKNLRANLVRTGEPGEALTTGRLLKNFETHTLNIMEIFASSRWGESKISGMVEIDGKDVLDKALAEGHGAILVTAHVGNWELAALYLTSLGYKLYVVAGVQMNVLLSAAVRDAKEKRGIEVITPRDSYRKFFNALDNNGIIALLLDGDIYTGAVEIPFVGARTKMPKGPVSLSRKRGTPIVGGYCRRKEDGSFHVHCEDIISCEEALAISEDEALKRVYKSIENYIRINRDQWCIFRNLWG